MWQESSEETPWIFEQLCEHVNDVSPPPPPQLSDFNDESSMEALHAGAKQVSPRRAHISCRAI